MSIQPVDECLFVGPPGGPFDPESCDFTLVNSTAGDIEVAASFSLLFSPEWLEAELNGAPLPANGLEPVSLIVPANASVPFTLRLTASAVDVSDPDNLGVFGGIEFADPLEPQLMVSATGRFEFTEGNDNFSSARLVAAAGDNFSGSNLGAGKESGEPDHAGNPGGASLWWRYDAPDAVVGELRLSLEFSDIDTLLAVYTGTSVDSLQLVAANDDESAGNPLSQLAFEVVGGTTYYIAVDGAARGGGGADIGFYNLDISASLSATNDDFADAAEITGPAGTATLADTSAILLSRESGEPAHGGGLGSSAWFNWVAPATAVYSFTALVDESGLFPRIGVYLGGSVDQLVEVASMANLASTGNQLDVFASAGGEYRIALVDAGQSTDFEFSWALADPQPATGLFASILPASRAVGLGQVASVFANIFNSTGTTGINCRPEPPNQLLQFTPTGFDYQATNASNLLVGTPNTPVDIPAGNVQNWLLQMNSPTEITGGRIGVRFLCDNLIAAPIFPDVNGWVLRVLQVEPADVIAIGVSGGEPGVLDVPENGSAAFAAAGVNIGPDARIVVRPSTTFASDLSLTLCETDLTGACQAPPSAALTIPNFARDELRTFSVFAAAGSSVIDFNPAFQRVFLSFLQGPTDVGATSLAVRTAQ